MRHSRLSGLFFVFVLLGACNGQTPAAQDGSSAAPGAEPPSLSADEVSHARISYEADAGVGRDLFVSKGCVLCHSVNGVGGKAAPPLDASTELDAIDPLGFAARMWRGAPAMIELQNLELGYVIWLEPEEMANLAAFAADAAAQGGLTDADIPGPMRNMLLNERYWET
jgi:mono/diheme cytochrome c family protein